MTSMTAMSVLSSECVCGAVDEIGESVLKFGGFRMPLHAERVTLTGPLDGFGQLVG